MRVLFEDALSKIIEMSHLSEFSGLHQAEYLEVLISVSHNDFRLLPSGMEESWLERCPHPLVVTKLNQEYLNCERYERILNFFVDYSFLYPELSDGSPRARKRIEIYEDEIERVSNKICEISAKFDQYRVSFDVSILKFRRYHPHCSPPVEGPFLDRYFKNTG